MSVYLRVKRNTEPYKNIIRQTLKKTPFSWLAAVFVPLAYLIFYTPYGMDTTDFGYFYGYAWRILEGQIPYRDFSYIKPAFPLYWHAFWLWLTPHQWEILAGKAGFLFSLLISSWLSALYLAKLFELKKIKLPLSLLATAGFVFSIHSFPHMPWHTADGVLFSSAALFCAVCGWACVSGIMAAGALLCKQSFLLVPFGIAVFQLLWFKGYKKCLLFSLTVMCCLFLAFLWLWWNGAWHAFRAMTTGQLDIKEAFDAGIGIYLRQNWLLPLLALLPWLLITRVVRRKLPPFLMPAYLYLLILLIWQLYVIFSSKVWVGYGSSWPTLFMLLGGICVIFPSEFLLPVVQDKKSLPLYATSIALAVILLASWSVAISGGYKIPAMMATPLLFSFFLVHYRMDGSVPVLAWTTLFCGAFLFGAAWCYPYVFPARPLTYSELRHDAGDIYPMARGVKIDRVMYEKLRELKALRGQYGPRYKTLPAFSHAYYLNGDRPVYSSDWLIDWEINGKVDELYKELVDKDLVVFMERDQLLDEKADNYARAGYGVPQRVRKLWRVVGETPHFIVFRRPDDSEQE